MIQFFLAHRKCTLIEPFGNWIHIFGHPRIYNQYIFSPMYIPESQAYFKISAPMITSVMSMRNSARSRGPRINP